MSQTKLTMRNRGREGTEKKGIGWAEVQRLALPNQTPSFYWLLSRHNICLAGSSMQQKEGRLTKHTKRYCMICDDRQRGRAVNEERTESTMPKSSLNLTLVIKCYSGTHVKAAP